MNQVIILGNLTKEPEKVETSNKTLCKLVVAVNENYTNAEGERPVNFFNVIVWSGLAESCLKHLNKGSKVAVSGKLQNRTYETQDGEKRVITEIVANSIEFVGNKKAD